MGGFGAVKLALDHPEKFAFAGAMSPAIDVPRCAFTWRRLDQSRRFREIFGPDGSDMRHNSDPFVLVRSADPSHTPYLYVSCGSKESLLAPNREFAALLDRYGIAHEFHVIRGGHDWNAWNPNLGGLFESMRKQSRRASLSRIDVPARLVSLSYECVGDRLWYSCSER
jgi:putative tributyrin esterase